MTAPAPILANDRNSARLLDLKPSEFLSLVEAGHLPRGREIAPGVVRWDVEELRRIGRGDAIEDNIQW